MNDPLDKALVVFSGGQDSTTCLGWALNRFKLVEAVTFYYGQRHEVEVNQARKIAGQLKVAHHILHVEFFGQLVHSALTNQEDDVGQPHVDHPGLPASYVPNRNAFFLTLAHALAQTIQAGTVVIGVSQADYSGYPDCREPFVRAMEKTLNLGSESHIQIAAPLQYLPKAQVFNLAKTEGVLELVLQLSHTCYNGDASPNPWGRGCGQCPACLLRKQGYEDFMAIEQRYSQG